ncbi:hypothetical protein DF036_30560 [Burkholderia contaminans]|nr:hypothetical protein DF036_30560 [Burkholderia contaminans]
MKFSERDALTEFLRESDAVVFADFEPSRSYVLLNPSVIEDVDSPMIADHHSLPMGGDLAL